jgi:hypothetical protein
MNRWKATLTCTFCSKILKNPIELPCKHNVCEEHLNENKVQKQNKIICGECKQDFHVKGNEFKAIDFVKKCLNEQLYLNDEEITLKKQIEDSISVFYKLFQEFTLNKAKLDLGVHEHFQEMRFKIDEQREKLKEKIDEIALEMIDKTKLFEATFLKSLNEKLKGSLKSLEAKSLEEDLEENEETFRNPNILIESILEIQLKQEDMIENIQLKLNEINEVKENLKWTNEFKPNLSFDQDSFGLLNLNEYSSIDPFKSQILTDKQPFDLIKLCEFSSKDKWTLLYRGTRDGFGANDFHSKCDNHSNTITVLKPNGSSYIFGGFTSINWDCSSVWKSDPNAFLFSLTNKDNQPSKMRQLNITHSIFCHSSYGPTFGAGHDIYICNAANTTAGSQSNLGNSYQHPQPSQGHSYLTGLAQFQLSEIEVYKKE